MSDIHTPSMIIFIVMAVIFFLLYNRSKESFKDHIKPLDKKLFPLKDIMGVGFMFMRLIRYKYKTKLDRQMRKKLIELHEEEYNEFYLQAYWAAAGTYLVVGLFITSLFLVAMEGDTSAIILGLIVTSLLVFSVKQGIDKRVQQRHMLITMAFPDVVNKMIILSGAGLNLRAAWKKVATEMADETPLYLEMKRVVDLMENGVSDIIALESMSLRCSLPEMRRFISVIIQNIQRGGSDVLYVMQGIGAEMWNSRKATARRMAEEATTKMLFPMMLMLLSVIMMTVTPALLGMAVAM